MLDVLCTSASPLYMTSSSRNTYSASYSTGDLSRAPIVHMTSTSRMMNYMPSNSATSFECVRGITTVASSVMGGTTTYDTGAPFSQRRSKGAFLPDVCEHCNWVWDEEEDDYVCTVCGSHAQWGCDHMHDYGYCWCPVECDWKAILFLSALAGWYAMYKVRNGKKTQKNELIVTR